MNRLKKIISPLLITLAVFGVGAGIGYFGIKQVVLAQPSQALKDSACEGVALGGGGSCATANDPNDPNSATSQLNNTIATVINILSLVVGVAAVIMIIIGGFRYITSGGDSAAVNGAKNTVLYAIIGLVVVGVAQFIVRFVIGRL